MSKKNSGFMIALGAIIGGAAAVGLSYYLKYKSYRDEIDKDFHDYEEEDAEEEIKEAAFHDSGRTYITLDSNKAKAEEEAEEAEEAAAEEAVTEEAAEEEAEETAAEEAAPEESPEEETKTPAVTVEEDTEGAI